MKRLITMLLCALTIAASAQSITLDECIGMARENYPLIKRYRVDRTYRAY